MYCCMMRTSHEENLICISCLYSDHPLSCLAEDTIQKNDDFCEHKAQLYVGLINFMHHH